MGSGHKDHRAFHEREDAAWLPASMVPRLRRILFWLQEATHPGSDAGPAHFRYSAAYPGAAGRERHWFPEVTKVSFMTSGGCVCVRTSRATFGRTRDCAFGGAAGFSGPCSVNIQHIFSANSAQRIQYPLPTIASGGNGAWRTTLRTVPTWKYSTVYPSFHSLI